MVFKIFYRVYNHIKVKLRKKIFRVRTGTSHNEFTLYGNVNLLNTRIKIGKHVHIYPDVTFWGDGDIEIGDYCAIGMGTVIYASELGGVTIGSHTHIAGQCYIIDMDHGTQAEILIEKQENSVEKIEIGGDVWVSAGVKILKGSILHDHCVVGASSVVKGVIPENGIAIGVPAKVLKFREQ